ncbi:response regulator [Stenomitos frigidus]|uniref:histidine kinase n=1 Tax=Stenomitos frigidus ULC18 TaxID=2107698 RepID=A0A2T1E0M5_9CYAN|nr:response regulator [Stenomitos frigidus]PSB26316.1 multi-component transcriptional regulator [Stenomitos frigidus ULC18]
MKILVVEDDALTAEALVATLTHQNYAVEVASDGQAGWALAEAFVYDLILLDVTLPRLDGISLCQRLRSHGYQMPILLLTAHNSSHDKAVGLDAGADDYVVKPFEPEELTARVRALLRRGGVATSPVLEWGKLRLDPSVCEVSYADQLLLLTPKEYALLELFLRNPHRVFSCGMILEQLWTFEEIPSEEAVRTHIKGLRQKLKAVAEGHLVETVYGIGYRLHAGKPQGEKRTIDGAGDPPDATFASSGKQVGQQTLAAIAGVWEKFQARIHQQVAVLEAAITSLEARSLEPALKQQAIQEAHTLAGALGTFGLPGGSDLARQIEQLLKSKHALKQSQVKALRQLVMALRQTVERSPADPTPLTQAPSTQASSMLLAASECDRPPAQTAQVSVMVVDDDPKILALLQKILAPWGLALTTLEDPRQFWEILETSAPDLLILDVEMPYSNGIELCQAVRHDSRWSGLPILFLTAHTNAELVNQVFAAGADDFVSKPIVGPELVTRILNRLERVKLLKNLGTLRQSEQSERQHTEATLQKAKDELELRVAERTAELVSVNEQLRAELSERKQIEEELRVSQARFAGILEIADDAVISVDANQRITLFNHGAERIFGYTAQAAIGQPLDLLLPLRFAVPHQQHVAAFATSPGEARKMGERREIVGRRQNGEEFPAEASISKLQLKGEAVFTVILRDTSDRKVIERMKDEFISVVSHELRTPLTSIHGSLGMLASGLLDAEPETGKRLLDIAVDGTERLIRLLNDVLDVERIESGKVTMDKHRCNIAALMTNATDVMQAMAEKFGVTLSFSPLSIHVWADGDRIIQTLTNLLSNAIKFSAQGATVCLSATQQNDHVLLQVNDQGRGIPADKLETIFERFQQVDASDSRNQDGTGLGLAICRNIVQQHGGRIWVESTLGEGSTFYFTLPVDGKEGGAIAPTH